MKLLISTPCFGGQLTEGYTSSLLSSIASAIGEGLLEKCHVHFQGKESLIHRARDRAASFLLANDFEALLSIDADLSWSYPDFRRLITSPHFVIGGSYPIKAFPPTVNFNPLPDLGGEFLSEGKTMTLDTFKDFKEKYVGPEGLIEVRNLPTGFLRVKREVFEALRPDVKTYAIYDGVRCKIEEFSQFYPSEVVRGSLESEDFGFCRLVREAGFPIIFDTNIILGHTGSHTYKMGQNLTISSN